MSPTSFPYPIPGAPKEVIAIVQVPYPLCSADAIAALVPGTTRLQDFSIGTAALAGLGYGGYLYTGTSPQFSSPDAIGFTFGRNKNQSEIDTPALSYPGTVENYPWPAICEYFRPRSIGTYIPYMPDPDNTLPQLRPGTQWLVDKGLRADYNGLTEVLIEHFYSPTAWRTPVDVPFTAATSDVITVSDAALVPATGDPVYLSTSDTLPSPLEGFVKYYAVNISGATFKLSLTSAGSAMDITDIGTGTHTFRLCRDLTKGTPTTQGMTYELGSRRGEIIPTLHSAKFVQPRIYSATYSYLHTHDLGPIPIGTPPTSGDAEWQLSTEPKSYPPTNATTWRDHPFRDRVEYEPSIGLYHRERWTALAPDLTTLDSSSS